MGSLGVCDGSAERHPDVPSRSRPVSVFIVSDVRLLQEGLAALLQPILQVVGAAPPDEVTIARVAALNPRVVLIDSVTARRSRVVRDMAAAAPASCVVAFAVGDDHAEILACADAGVQGYIARDATAEELAGVVRQIDDRDFPCSPRIAAAMFQHATAIARAHGLAPLSPLTTRERQVLTLIDRGLTNKEIATELAIGLTTVKNHVHHVLDKLRVKRRSAAAAKVRTMDPVP